MRALVTGGGGLVGSALVDELVSSGGYQVLAPSRADADLLDLGATTGLFDEAAPEVVFHLAARVAGLGGNLAAPGQMFYDNVLINTNVVEAARSAGVKKFVAVGSAAIYSDIVSLPMSEDDLWLGPPHSSEGPYGHAKRTMLAHLEAYQAQYGMDYAYCILTNTFGPNDKFDEKHGHVLPSLISKFHRGVATGEAVTVWGTGTARRDFLYSKDVAKALRLLGERGSGAVNVASGREVSIRDLASLIQAVSGYSGPVHWDTSKPNGQELRQYDVARLRSVGFVPFYTLEEAVAETYEWFDRNSDRARR